jgi:hypothetical protein
VFGILGFIAAKRHQLALPLLIIALFGLYFSLGPSLKIDAIRPAGISSPLMPASAAPIPTGSGIIYQKVVGFTSMRSTYRWIDLLFVGMYGLTLLLIVNLEARNKKLLVLFIPLFLVISNLPHIHQRLVNGMHYRDEMQSMLADLQPLNSYLKNGHHVVFYPHHNEFMANYLSAFGQYYTYNVGGDKNIMLAYQHWPQSVINFFYNPDINLEQAIPNLLETGTADYVVLPYFDLLWNLAEWPPNDVSAQKIMSQDQCQCSIISIASVKANYDTLLLSLKSNPNLIVKATNLYTVISLKHTSSS